MLFIICVADPHVIVVEALTPSDLTPAVITPIVNNITTILTGVVTDLQALAGQPASVILADNANTPVGSSLQARDLLGLDAIAQLVAALLNVSP